MSTSLPPVIAVMFPTNPHESPDVIAIHAILPGIPLRDQFRRALSPWMEPTDRVETHHTSAGRIGVIVTEDAEDADVFAVEVPAEKRREAVYRWARAERLAGLPTWPGFTEAHALEFLDLALARKD